MDNMLKTPPEPINDAIKVHGFFRVQIEDGPTGEIVGDSGWLENALTNEGFDDFLCRLISQQTSSKYISYVGLGTGTEPGAAHTTLDGEILNSAAALTRKSVTVSISDSKTVVFTATFASGDEHISAQQSLQNIGLFDVSSASSTLFAGKTYASSTCNTNQNVNVTYQIRFQ